MSEKFEKSSEQIKLEKEIAEKKSQINNLLLKLQVLELSLKKIKGDEDTFVRNSKEIARRFF